MAQMNQEELQAKEEDYLKIVELAKKAEQKGMLAFDILSLIMDLQNVHESIGLRLDDFLGADDFNFAHDIVGIQNHINRETKKLEGFFLPRWAKLSN